MFYLFSKLSFKMKYRSVDQNAKWSRLISNLSIKQVGLGLSWNYYYALSEREPTEVYKYPLLWEDSSSLDELVLRELNNAHNSWARDTERMSQTLLNFTEFKYTNYQLVFGKLVITKGK